MTTFVVGDIHGRAKALEEVFLKSGFDKTTDTLIVLGDIVDGGLETARVFDILETVEKRIIITGNHDEWWLKWAQCGLELPIWVHQGGYASMRSYDFKWMNVPKSHRLMIEKSRYYYINKNRVFVHGGFNPKIPIYHNTTEFLTWDRTLIDYAKEHIIDQFDEVFIGHTTTQLFKTNKPVQLHNLWMLDTGAGWNGKLTIMDIDTKEYWQSKEQYPAHIEGLLETEDGLTEFEDGVL